MGYTKEKRLDIGKQIYNNEITKSDAAVKYGISEGTARNYMRLYRDINNLPPKNRVQTEGNMTKISAYSSEPGLDKYESMQKDQLIRELIKLRIRVARLKKGYEVKGVGAEKTVTIFDNWNMK